MQSSYYRLVSTGVHKTLSQEWQGVTLYRRLSCKNRHMCKLLEPYAGTWAKLGEGIVLHNVWVSIPHFTVHVCIQESVAHGNLRIGRCIVQVYAEV